MKPIRRIAKLLDLKDRDGSSAAPSAWVKATARMKLVSCLLVVALLGTPALSQHVSEREIEAMATIANRCISNFPDMGAAGKAHRQAKMKNEGRSGPYTVYSTEGGAVVTFGTRGTKNSQCFVGVSGLQERKAEQIGQGLITLLEIPVGKELSNDQKPNYMWKAWPAQINGKIAVVGITRIQDFRPFYRGSFFVIQGF